MIGKIMAIDLGSVRIGVAVSDGLGLCANPVAVVRSKGEDADLARILSLAEECEATEFVVGLPLNMDGTESKGSVQAREFARRLRAAAGKPVHLWDERLSTVEAQEAILQSSVRKKKRRQVVDKVAASIFLQDFLDNREGK